MSATKTSNWRRLTILGLFSFSALNPFSVAQDETTPLPAPGISIELLDSLTQLPGNLSALPLSPPIPAGNPQTPAKIELGKMLFFDTRLSRDGSLSCATCHDPDKGFSDARPRAVGIGNKILARRSPTVLNAAYNPLQFWDGRAHSLEEQAAMPILSSVEMGMPDRGSLVSVLEQIPDYRERFDQVFGGPVSFQHITAAIAAFERTLVTPNSAFDRYARGDKQALTEPQKRGLIVFFGKASCTQCHNGPNFTDNKFYALGLLPGEGETRDPGRFAISKDPLDQSAFKTPSLRNVTDRAPYLHNGSIATLPEVIDWYNRGGGEGQKSDLIHPLGLTADEQNDLLSFIVSLNGKAPKIQKPNFPADATNR